MKAVPFVYGGEAGSGSELARDIVSKAYPSAISVYQPKRAISPCTQVRRLAKQDAFALPYRPGCFNRSHKRSATSLPALMAKLPAPPPHSRKASLATPRKILRGVCVCACGCVYASQKYGRSPRSSFLCVAPKLSRRSLIFAPRDGGCRRHLRVSNFGHVRKVRSLILALKRTQHGVPIKYRSKPCARGHFMGLLLIPSLRLDIIF